MYMDIHKCANTGKHVFSGGGLFFAHFCDTL